MNLNEIDYLMVNDLAEKQIGELKPLEMVNAKELGVGQGFSILKVPGGWIFIFIDSSCFVPEPAKTESKAPAKKKAQRVKSTKKDSKDAISK